MGTSASRADQPWSTSLKCLLANLRTLHISGEIRSKRLTFLCSEAWPQYSLDNSSQWPPTRTFDFNILRDLDNYCQRTGKWSEVPYVQAFWLLRSRPTLYTHCSPSKILLTMALPSPTPTPSISTPPPWSSQPSPPVTMPLAAPLAPPQYPPLPPCPSLSDSPVSSHTRSHTAPNLTPAPLLPLRQVAGPEGLTHVHVPFSLQDLAHIEQWLGSYSANPSNYIKNFTQLSQSYTLTWQDVFVTLGSTTTPEERKAIWATTRVVADRRHLANPADPARPPGTAAIPDVDPD